MSVNFNNKESYSNSKFEEQITNHNFEEENEDEFWADTLNIEENKSKDKNQVRSQSSDKENNSTNISKKLRFDVSLFKGVEFDDLVLDEKNPEDNYGNDYIDSAPNFESQILISEINIKDNACSNICLNTTINDEHFINMSKYRRNQCTSQKSSSKSVENKIIMSLLNKESSCTKNKSNAIAAKSNIPQSKLKETKKQRPISTVTDRSKPIHKVKVLLPTPSKAERLNKLYQKNKEKNTKLELRKKKQDEEKQLKELEACSFKPKLNKKFNDTHKASILQMSMYDRQVSWSNKKQDKINKDKHFNALQEKYECTFTPDVKKRTAEFDSIWRYDKTTKNYFRRIKNAKDLNEELKSKLNPDYNDRYERLMKHKLKTTLINGESNEDDWQTFNPSAIKQINYDDAKLGLREHLHSLNIDHEHENSL